MKHLIVLITLFLFPIGLFSKEFPKTTNGVWQRRVITMSNTGGTIGMVSLAKLYNVKSTNAVIEKSMDSDFDMLIKAGKLGGDKESVDDTTELAYLDFITVKDISTASWARVQINQAFPKNKKGAINMAILLLKGKVENPKTAGNYIKAINDIRAQYGLSQSVADIQTLYAKSIPVTIEKLAMNNFKGVKTASGTTITNAQIKSYLKPVIAYYTNPTNNNYNKLVNATADLIRGMTWNKTSKHEFKAYCVTLEDLSKQIYDRVLDDAAAKAGIKLSQARSLSDLNYNF